MKNNHVLGDFTWTAYDNLGEAGTGRFLWERDGFIPGISLADYPWRACYQGDFDLCGFRRPQSYFRESIWVEDCEPKIFTTHPEHYGEGFSGTDWHWYDVHDTWTFDDKYIGKPVKVEVYTDADEIKFILNGKDIASATPIDGIATADIKRIVFFIGLISFNVKLSSKCLNYLLLPNRGIVHSHTALPLREPRRR
jgi:beta-galactosidase